MPAARKILATGSAMQVTHLSYGAGDSAGEHEHAFEQCGFVLSGAFRLRLDGGETELGAGDAYMVPAGARHAFKVVEPGEVVIVAPPAQTNEGAEAL